MHLTSYYDIKFCLILQKIWLHMFSTKGGEMRIGATRKFALVKVVESTTSN